ncbi:unnamed protein product [Cuscuta campestris]|uniref:Retrovirus-related Pol polyprotein from transposon TNT 1-94-like beta-barrel domain-containing protein n=1 Tax=Cuscuta campestris TaxID=132261 RepID=A0A484KXZ3_9ASTE|nr:unnamed protein product [Cuscuta campestris]
MDEKEYVLEKPIPPAPPANAPKAVKDAYKKHVKDDNQVSCVMLATMITELQKQHEDMKAHEMIVALRQLYQGQSRHERFLVSKALFSCKLSSGNPVERSPELGAFVAGSFAVLSPESSLSFEPWKKGRNLENYTVQGLLDELRTYEHELKKKKEEQVTPFPTTLMTAPRVPSSEGTCPRNCDTPSSSQLSSSKMENYDEEFAMMVKQFRKFKKLFKKADSVKRPSKGKPQVSDSPPESYLCYNCRKPGYWKSACPYPKVGKYGERERIEKKKKAMVAAESDESSSSSSDEEALICMERRAEKSNHEDRWTMSDDDTLCLMPKDDADQEVTSQTSCSSSYESIPTSENLFDQFKKMMKDFEEINLKHSSLTKENKLLSEENLKLTEGRKSQLNEITQLKTENESLSEKEATKYPGVWYLDSGCSRHMTGDVSLLSNLIPYDGPRVTFGGSNDFGLTKGLGNLVYKGLTIQAVSYVEGINYNLLSISQFCDKGYSLEFCKDMASLKNISTNEVILTGKRIRNIYEVVGANVHFQKLEAKCSSPTFFQSYLQMIAAQELSEFLQMEIRLKFEEVVLEFYRNGEIKTAHSKKDPQRTFPVIKSSVGGTKVKLSQKKLGEKLRLPNSGVEVGKFPVKNLDWNIIGISGRTPSGPAKKADLNNDYKLVLELIIACLECGSGGHADNITQERAFIINSLITKTKVNWAAHFFNSISKHLGKSNQKYLCQGLYLGHILGSMGIASKGKKYEERYWLYYLSSKGENRAEGESERTLKVTDEEDVQEDAESLPMQLFQRTPSSHQVTNFHFHSSSTPALPDEIPEIWTKKVQGLIESALASQHASFRQEIEQMEVRHTQLIEKSEGKHSADLKEISKSVQKTLEIISLLSETVSNTMEMYASDSQLHLKEINKVKEQIASVTISLQKQMSLLQMDIRSALAVASANQVVTKDYLKVIIDNQKEAFKLFRLIGANSGNRKMEVILQQHSPSPIPQLPIAIKEGEVSYIPSHLNLTNLILEAQQRNPENSAQLLSSSGLDGREVIGIVVDHFSNDAQSEERRENLRRIKELCGNMKGISEVAGSSKRKRN